MLLHQAFARIVFTSLWAKRINQAGYQVRKVHGLTRATVWDGAEERVVRFFFAARKVEPTERHAPVEDLPLQALEERATAGQAMHVGAPEYVMCDSRAPFAVALGVTRSVAAVIPRLEPATVGGPARSGRTNAPFASPYLAD